jgi:hypothetical protein
MKVFELAKKLNMKAADLLKQLNEQGEDVKSINASLSESQEAMITEVVTGSPTESRGEGKFKTNIAFVRLVGDEKYELVKAVIDENNNITVKSVKNYTSRVRAFMDLGYENGLIEMERFAHV